MGVGPVFKCANSFRTCLRANEPLKLTPCAAQFPSRGSRLLWCTGSDRANTALGFLMVHTRIPACLALFPFKLEVWNTGHVQENEKKIGKRTDLWTRLQQPFQKDFVKKEKVCTKIVQIGGEWKGKHISKLLWNMLTIYLTFGMAPSTK